MRRASPFEPRRMKISVVIPVYNERERLPPSLGIVREYLNRRGESWEIVVADDGSTDGSVAEIEASFPDVRFLRAPRNEGKGAAVRRGMLAARGELILFTDADLSTPIDELDSLLSALRASRADGAIASRGLPESRLELRQPWWREMSGRIFNTIVRPLSGLPIRDTQCGFKLFTREAARAIFPLCRCNRWAFDVEALMVAALLGLRIVETPVRWINSDASKVRMLKDAPRMAIDIVRFRWRHFTGEYERRRAEFASAAAPSEPVADDAREDSALDEPEALSAHGRRSISPRIH